MTDKSLYDQVKDLVGEAMRAQDTTTYHGESSKTDGVAEIITQKIMEIFDKNNPALVAKMLTNRYIDSLRCLGYTDVEVAYANKPFKGLPKRERGKTWVDPNPTKTDLPFLGDPFKTDDNREAVRAAKLYHEGADNCVVVRLGEGYEHVHKGTCPQAPKTFVDPSPTRTDIPVYDGPGSDAWAKENPARDFEVPPTREIIPPTSGIDKEEMVTFKQLGTENTATIPLCEFPPERRYWTGPGQDGPKRPGRD